MRFERQPRIQPILTMLAEVGLGYLALDQSSTTLSGGEAQRLNLAAELMSASGVTPSVVMLDEPTTGLHAADVAQLLRVLDRLVERGNAVVVVKHNVDVLEVCDRLIELGPGGGEDGGRIVAEGTPREIAADPASITGRFLFRADPALARENLAPMRLPAEHLKAAGDDPSSCRSTLRRLSSARCGGTCSRSRPRGVEFCRSRIRFAGA